MMKLAYGVVGVALVVAFCRVSGWSQTPDVVSKPRAIDNTVICSKNNTCVEQTFYLTNVTQGNPYDGNEIQTALRNLLPPDVKIFLVPSREAIVISATPEQLALAQKLIGDLDQPKKVYRLTYTITESDSGKRVSAQHFSLIAEDGQHVTLKQGSRVPLVVGGTNKDGPAQNQVQYLDIGMNFDATVSSTAGGGVLKSKVEQSSLAEEKSGVGPEDPVIRQTALEGTSVLTLGKPLVLGSVDVPGSTRHLDVEVVMELVK